jgi:hypothetical protein
VSQDQEYVQQLKANGQHREEVDRDHVFFPFDFTPVNSTAAGPFGSADGSFEFASNTQFANPITGLPAESLIFSFVPVSPLTDASSTIINNSNINVNDPFSDECFNCTPYVCFAGATSSVCVASTVPEPSAFSLVALGICVLCGTSAVRKWRDRF